MIGSPVVAAWNVNMPASCIDRTLFYYANNALNVLTNIAVLVLPLHMLWNLSLPRRQKLGIAAVFMSGVL